MKLVSNWKSLWKAASMRFAFAGVAAPELLQFVADNTDYLPWVDPDVKNLIRVACLAGVILTRPIQQASVSGQKP